MDVIQAAVLGIVEGLTEYLPVSSTGHLILTSRWLGLSGEAVKTFDVVIQAGAIAAVLNLYRARVLSMGRGLLGRDPAGARLAANLAASFLPAAVAGLMLHELIKARLFGVGPVAFALAAGGLFMLWVDRWARSRAKPALELASLTTMGALGIGLAQCLALWPGTSRAMVTMAAAMLIGFPAPAAAEYSFLLALPTLGAATLLDAVQGGPALIHEISWLAFLSGFLTAFLVAMLAMRGLIRYLTKHGLALFGWYRLALAAVVWFVLR
jgi:undecaprenyl-diphosphatase